MAHKVNFTRTRDPKKLEGTLVAALKLS